MAYGGQVVKVYDGWGTMVEDKEHPVTGFVTVKEIEEILFELTKK